MRLISFLLAALWLNCACAQERIVSLAPSFTEILYALGMDRQIIGTTSFCDYPPQAQKTAKVGDMLNPNLEQIILLKPDLVLCGAWKWQVPDKLRNVGINVIEIKDAENLQDSLNRVRLIGEKVGRKDAAEKIIAYMQSRMNAIRGRIPQGGHLKVYIELDAGQWTVGGTSYLNDVCSLIGLQNIFHDYDDPYLMVTMESILSRDPDLIISLNRHAREYTDSPAWQASRAVRKGKIIDRTAMDWNAITHQSPRLVDGIEQLEKHVRSLFKLQ
jgi:iron complex transport system substrate-binding protein